MLISLDITEKSLGLRHLFENLRLTFQENSKVAIIGRNGIGKTTLFRLIAGEDTDYSGNIEIKKGVRVVVTQQEHFIDGALTPLEYVLSAVPRFAYLQNILEEYPDRMAQEPDLIRDFSAAVQEFSERNYYHVEEEILSALADYGLDVDRAMSPMARLSGGEKRFVELVKVNFSDADIALIDEPTNHMDYVGKARFIEWLRAVRHAVVVITHDRDVLNEVNKIIEIKDRQAFSFNGNYRAYLAQNSVSTITKVDQYENALKTLEKLHGQAMVARTRKLSAHSDSGRNNAKTQEERLLASHAELKAALDKPSFWIDQETLASSKEKVVASYHKYKDRNIRIHHKGLDEYKRELLNVYELSIGYGEIPLFANVSFTLEHGDRVFLKGRNGAGKSSLLKTILAAVQGEPLPTYPFAGDIAFSDKVRIGVYEQEVDARFLRMTLGDAVEETYREKGLELTSRELNGILASYLFEPMGDKELTIDRLSGGQKARFQLIRMLCHTPNLLILDEPTNHLDLPSIEELEKALLGYEGAILYVSHDSFFVEKLGGETVEIGA